MNDWDKIIIYSSNIKYAFTTCSAQYGFARFESSVKLFIAICFLPDLKVQ